MVVNHLYVLLMCCVCGCQAAQLHTRSRASELQAQIGARGSTASQICEASKELRACPLDEMPEQWIRQSQDAGLSQLARDLSFDAFWRRFVKPPTSLRRLVEKYHMGGLVLPSLIKDDNRESGAIFDDEKLPNGKLAGLYIWAATNLPDGLFVCLKTSEVDSADQ